MNRQEVIFCSEEELTRHLLPIDDQMSHDGVPAGLRPMKGWHLFMTAEHLDIPLRDPASDRVIHWFKTFHNV